MGSGVRRLRVYSRKEGRKDIHHAALPWSVERPQDERNMCQLGKKALEGKEGAKLCRIKNK